MLNHLACSLVALAALIVCNHPAQRAIAAEPSRILIRGCAVFDPATEQFVPDQYILVEGTTIAAVGPLAEAPAAFLDTVPPDALLIDGRGKFAIPGLIDAHVHVVHVLDFAQVTGDEVLPLYLAAGVTSIRSTGDEIVAATLVARFAEAHPETCPRVFTCSPLLDADPPIHRDVGRGVTNVAQVGPLLDELGLWNVSTIKIYAGTGPEIGAAIIREAHARGMFVTAHLGAYTAQQAVADGIDGLEHIWSVFNYSLPPDLPPQAAGRGSVDLDNPICQALLADLAKKQVLVDPTLAVFRNMILLCDAPEAREVADEETVPQRLREFWPKYLAQSGCPQGGALADRRREFAKFQELTGRLYRAGVPLLVGTDAPEPNVPPGLSMHQELEMLVESGLPPGAALKAATLHNARALRQEERLGSITAGKLADLVLLGKSPLENIRNTRTIELVMRGGRVSSTIQARSASE